MEEFQLKSLSKNIYKFQNYANVCRLWNDKELVDPSYQLKIWTTTNLIQDHAV